MPDVKLTLQRARKFVINAVRANVDVLDPEEHELVKEIDTALAALSQSAWRPIEEAPKDGTVILVVPAGGEFNTSVAFYYPGSAGAVWIIPETNRYLTVEPTHWMPLPEPPQAEETKV